MHIDRHHVSLSPSGLITNVSAIPASATSALGIKVFSRTREPPPRAPGSFFGQADRRLRTLTSTVASPRPSLPLRRPTLSRRPCNSPPGASDTDPAASPARPGYPKAPAPCQVLRESPSDRRCPATDLSQYHHQRSYQSDLWCLTHPDRQSSSCGDDGIPWSVPNTRGIERVERRHCRWRAGVGKYKSPNEAGKARSAHEFGAFQAAAFS